MKRGKAATVQTMKAEKAIRSAIRTRALLPSPLDSSTPERVLRSGEEMKVADSGAQRFGDWPVQKLYDRGSLGEQRGKARLTAAELFYEYFIRSEIGAGPAGVDLNRTGRGEPRNGMPIPASESAYMHRQRFRSAQAALGDDAVSRIVGLVVLNEVALAEAAAEFVDDLYTDRAQRTASALTLLCIGLDRLDKHFNPKGEQSKIRAWSQSE